MRRRAEEAEVIARLDYATGETHICVVSWPSMARRMERLYGKPLDSGGQVQRWKVPGHIVGFRKLRKTPVLAPVPRENRQFRELSIVGMGKQASGVATAPKPGLEGLTAAVPAFGEKLHSPAQVETVAPQSPAYNAEKKQERNILRLSTSDFTGEKLSEGPRRPRRYY